MKPEKRYGGHVLEDEWITLEGLLKLSLGYVEKDLPEKLQKKQQLRND